MLFGDFGVKLQMIGHLRKIVRQSFKIDAFRSRCPPKMKIVWLFRADVLPELGALWAAFDEYPLHQIRIIASVNLKLVYRVLISNCIILLDLRSNHGLD